MLCCTSPAKRRLLRWGWKTGVGVFVCAWVCACVCVCACVRIRLGTSICKVQLVWGISMNWSENTKEWLWLNTGSRLNRVREKLYQWVPIDLLPNYGPGTSKRYRKPVTTGNTVIFNCEKRNFRRSSDLAEAKIYLFAVLVIFDMHSTNHFFRSFCSQVGIMMVLEGFLGCLFSDAQRCCIEILTTFPTSWTSQNRAGHSNQPKKILRKVSVRNLKFMEGKSQELSKPRSILTTSRQRSSSSYWSCVTFVSYTVARSLFSVKCRSLDSNLTSSG